MNRRISLKKLINFISGSFPGEELKTFFFLFCGAGRVPYKAGNTDRFSDQVSLPFESRSLEPVIKTGKHFFQPFSHNKVTREYNIMLMYSNRYKHQTLFLGTGMFNQLLLLLVKY